MNKEFCRDLWNRRLTGPAHPKWDSVGLLLQRYVEILLKRTESINLVSRSQRSEDAVWLHILDCLHAQHVLDADDNEILDVGSGNGLPGIVLAAAIPTATVVLLDRSEKKADFLDYAVASLGLRNARVVCSEHSDRVMLEVSPNLVTMRALENIDSIKPFRFTHSGACRWLVYSTETNVTSWLEMSKQAHLSLKQQFRYELPDKKQARVLLKFTS